MTRRQARRQFDADRAVLLEFWRDWDPVGGADDDYDCQITPTLKALNDGSDVDQLKRDLVRELAAHYGVEEPAGAGEFASKVMRWWMSRRAVSAND